MKKTHRYIFIKHSWQPAIVDWDDFDRVSRWPWICIQGYAKRTNNMRMHRFITNCPDDMVVDHINHNRLDNRKCNLRIVTMKENGQNHGKLRTDNTSGVRGVSFDSKKGKWFAQVYVSGKTIKRSWLATKEDAAKAREELEAKYFAPKVSNLCA